LKAVPAINGSAFSWLEWYLRLLAAGRAGCGIQFPFGWPSARCTAAVEVPAGGLASAVFSLSSAVLAARRLIVPFFREKILLVGPENKAPAAVPAHDCQIFSCHFIIPSFARCAQNKAADPIVPHFTKTSMDFENFSTPRTAKAIG